MISPETVLFELESSEILDEASLSRADSGRIRYLQQLMHLLGMAKYEPAVPILVKVLHDSPQPSLQAAASDTLWHIHSPQALKALVDQLATPSDFKVFMAVRAIFDAAPLDAYDKLSHYFGADDVHSHASARIAIQILRLFTPTSVVNNQPLWTEQRAPQWLKDDPRWIGLAVQSRDVEKLKSHARQMLKYVDRKQLAPLLAQATRTTPPKPIEFTTKSQGDLVARYGGGEFDVWNTLRSFQAIEGDLRLEALEVARLMMARVAHNVDLLAARLKAKGWVTRFGLRDKPNPKIDAPLIADYEKAGQCPIPCSLLAFWQIVGGVDFMWDQDALGDPPPLAVDLSRFLGLRINPPDGAQYGFEIWKEQVQEDESTPFSLGLAPNPNQPADSYEIDLPFFGVDPIIKPLKVCFVDHLRHHLKWAGFGGLEKHADDAGVYPLVQELSAGFEPF